MVKVLQFTIAASQGGHTQYVTNIWRLMNRSKIHFDFVTFSKNIAFAQELVDNGCRVHQMSVYPEENMERFVDEFGKVLDCGYDSIELHTSFWKNTIVEKMARERGIKIIVHAHSTGISTARDKEEERRFLERHLAIKSKLDESLADYYFACSQSAADWLFGDVIPQERIRIIHNMIDTKRFAFCKETRRRMRESLQLEGRFVLGHVARLERVKNQHFLIEIFAEIYKRINNAALLIVGDGSERESLEKQAEALGIGDVVVFAGKQLETELYYQAMDLFLLPSLLEGFPIVLLEAQCGGLRCLCSEGVSSEVCITDLIQRLPLCAPALWIQEIMKAVGIHEREDKSDLIKRCGYDTNEQVKMIEELYQGIV